MTKIENRDRFRVGEKVAAVLIAEREIKVAAISLDYSDEIRTIKASQPAVCGSNCFDGSRPKSFLLQNRMGKELKTLGKFRFFSREEKGERSSKW